MVLEAVKSHAPAFEQCLHPRIALQRQRLIIVVGEYRVHRQAGHERLQCMGGGVMPDQQAGARFAMGVAEPQQLLIEVQQRFPDEFHAAIGAGQRRQNVTIKDEDAQHLAAGFQRVKKRCVVFHPQITPKPHQAGIVFF